MMVTFIFSTLIAFGVYISTKNPDCHYDLGVKWSLKPGHTHFFGYQGFFLGPGPVKFEGKAFGPRTGLLF